MTDEQVSRLERLIVAELAKVHTQLDETNARINETNIRLENGLRHNSAKIERVEDLVRAIADSAGAANQSSGEIRIAAQATTGRVERLEIRADVHERRISALESKPKRAARKPISKRRRSRPTRRS